MSARAAQRRVLPLVRLAADPTPQVVADLCLKVLTHLRTGRAELAAQTTRDAPSTRHVYDCNGVPVTEETSIGKLIATEWAPVFSQREVDPEHMQFFLSFSPPPGAGSSSWTWPRGRISEVAARMPASAPGPDGLPY